MSRIQEREIKKKEEKLTATTTRFLIDRKETELPSEIKDFIKEYVDKAVDSKIKEITNSEMLKPLFSMYPLYAMKKSQFKIIMLPTIGIITALILIIAAISFFEGIFVAFPLFGGLALFIMNIYLLFKGS